MFCESSFRGDPRPDTYVTLQSFYLGVRVAFLLRAIEGYPTLYSRVGTLDYAYLSIHVYLHV